MFIEVAFKALISTEDAKQKYLTASFMVDTETFGDAEEKAQKAIDDLLGSYTPRNLTSAKISKIKEVFGKKEIDENESFFKITFNINSLDEESGVEKTTKDQCLIVGDTAQSAVEKMKSETKGYVSDIEIIRVEKTNILSIL